jgi:Spy/CpxP family protein refolding chaperone
MSENQVNDKVDDIAPEPRRSRSRHGFWLGIFLGGLVGALFGGALVSTAGVSAASLATGHAFRGHFGARLSEDPERAKEHLDFATDWVLSRVDATADQKAHAREIADRTLDELRPLAEQHRANREDLATELAKVEIDTTALERIRQSEVGLVDELSKELTAALTEIAQTLTPEQRSRLIEEAHKFRH